MKMTKQTFFLMNSMLCVRMMCLRFIQAFEFMFQVRLSGVLPCKNRESHFYVSLEQNFNAKISIHKQTDIEICIYVFEKIQVYEQK